MTEAVDKTTKINKLVMDGFKSFGKRTELLFESGFNVILGPNGSGKSNVLDALCFVLGKSSSKSLRAEKSANLIYNGGKSKNPAKAAEVSIFFDNKKRAFPIDEDSVKISRLVNAKGVSRYKVNNKIKTRSEVVDTLAHVKIYPDGYNIILQGDIVKLVEMSSVERRKIVEEIAGISVYEEKKNKALNELLKVEEKLNEAEIIMKERHSYLKDLKKDRDQALKYKNLSDKISQNKASYLKKRIDKKTSENELIEGRTNKHKSKLEKIKLEINKIRTEIQERKDKIKTISDEIEEKGEVEQIKLQKEIEQVRVDLATFKTKVSSCKNELGKVNQRKEQLGKNLESLKDKTSTLQESKKEFEEKKTYFSQQITELNKKISDFKKKHKLDQSGDIEINIEKIDKNAETKQKIIQELREKQQNLLREKDKCEFQIQTIDEQIEKVIELEREHKAEIDVLKKKKNQFKKLTLELNELLNSDSEQAGNLADLKTNIQRSREKIEKLKVKNARIKETMFANIAVKKVLENKNKLGEIYGTISELGTVDAKYSSALEIVAASKINSIVVETDKVAADCIRFLKQNKLGIASFIPLNKIKPINIKAETKELENKKGVIGHAINLIEFNPKFKNAFSYVFGNTLVVDHINTARNLGIGKTKMVTIDGDITERSGAMIGGFRHKKLGGFKQKDLTEDIKILDKKIKSEERQISNLETERTNNELKINKLRELKANLEGDIIKTEKGLHLESGDLEANRQYKEELKNKIIQVEKDMEKVNNTISEETSILTNLKIDKQKLRSQIQELRNPRLIAELNSFEQKKKEFTEECIKIDGELKSFDMQENEMIGKDKENTIKIIKELEKEDKTFNKEINEYNEKIKSLFSTLKVKEKNQEKFFSQFKGLFEKRNKLNDEINLREKKIICVEENSRKVELTINSFSIEEARIRAELAGFNAEFAKYEGVELNMKKPEEQLKKEISDFEKMMVNIGNVNMRALEIYETIEKEYGILLKKKDTLITEKDDVMMLMGEIEKSKKDLFTNALNEVNKNFKRFFTSLSTKGEAYLDLENPEKPFEEGLRIKVRLTGNKYMDIRGLSGGEKTMTALAFLFAIQEHEPASFYVLDEVDAALDKTNSKKLAKLVRTYCGKAQYVIISHNDSIIAEADTLYGVSMNTDFGLSKIVSLRI